MNLKKVTIRQIPDYASINPGRWVGEIEYEGHTGNCSIVLASEVAEPLLEHIAPIIVKFSQKAAEEIGAQLIEKFQNLKAIEAPEPAPPKPEESHSA